MRTLASFGVLVACGGHPPSPVARAPSPPASFEGATARPDAAPAYAAAEVDACADDLSVPASQGVVALPKSVMRASLRPAYRALCACLPHGAQVAARVRLHPEAGRSEAEVDDDALAACVRRELGAGAIPAFELGSDCVDCGPRHFDAWHGGRAPAGRPSSTLMLSLRFVRP